MRGKLARGLIPDGEGEHAAEAREHGCAVAGVEGEEDFGVRGGAEGDALRFELGAELAEVVDLAIEDDSEIAIAPMHGLGGARVEIEDGEPAMAEDGG